MKKILVFTTILTLLLSTACQKIDADSDTGIDTNSSLTDSDIDTDTTTIPQHNASVPDIVLEHFSYKIEAEDIEIPDDLKVEDVNEGYSGDGYVTDFVEKTSQLEFEVKIPQNQHYDIAITISSTAKKNNQIFINHEIVSEIISSGKDGYEKIIIENVYINKGKAKITLKSVMGGIDIDCFEIKDNQSLSKNESTPTDLPINVNANATAKNTLKYLVENNGKKFLSGQYASINSNRELELIYETTGKYPALRGGDMIGYTSNTIEGTDDVGEAIKWARKGGLISYVWHWESPDEKSSYYSDLTDFRISDIITKKNVALKSIDELEKMQNNGEIDEKLVDLIRDIDTVSLHLSRLQDNGVAVLWRPLHEASGKWFWWGADGKEEYFWLWDLLYERQTYYHQLNNLLWVWNAQNEDWYVGDDKCDIISADVYNNNIKTSSQATTYLNMAKISSKKLVTLSECDTPPEINFMLRDKAKWSGFCVWSGDYIMNDFGELVESYTTKKRLTEIYNHIDTITLDNLPDFR